jgi:hypothetical protein
MDLQAKAVKIKQILNGFLIKLTSIQQRKLETYKRLESEQEQEKIKNIEQKIKNL